MCRIHVREIDISQQSISFIPLYINNADQGNHLVCNKDISILREVIQPLSFIASIRTECIIAGDATLKQAQYLCGIGVIV